MFVDNSFNLLQQLVSNFLAGTAVYVDIMRHSSFFLFFFFVQEP